MFCAIFAVDNSLEISLSGSVLRLDPDRVGSASAWAGSRRAGGGAVRCASRPRRPGGYHDHRVWPTPSATVCWPGDAVESPGETAAVGKYCLNLGNKLYVDMSALSDKWHKS